MNRYFYDLHLHSCLSPCGDNDNTPGNLAGMASLKGLQILALTDHNTCGNCPAFFEACKQMGIVPIPGMELTTAEDIHLICLFPTLELAMEFDKAVQAHRILIPNRVDIFGEQLLMNGQDEVIGGDDYLLSNATNLSLDDAYALGTKAGGLVYPAHIDRESNGIVATLGWLPETPDFSVVEFHSKEAIADYEARFPALQQKQKVVCSDAHYLWDMNEAENFLMLEDEPYSSAFVRCQVLYQLSGDKRFRG